jgi:tetratricopeptide (TPR) repeat protein
MNMPVDQISMIARGAAQKKDWATVHAGAIEILKQDDQNAEGHFLMGLAEKAAQHPAKAVAAFEASLRIDDNRHDSAIELADQYTLSRRSSEAVALIDKYLDRLDTSPRYLDMAGTTLSNLGLHHKAWPLFQKANELQPDIELFRANLAACAVFIGEIDIAEDMYRKLLAKRPEHQRNHYQLARLRTAKDEKHIEQMRDIVDKNEQPPHFNIYAYYAIAKEFEDLGKWDEAFHWYKTAGDAVASAANYSIQSDVGMIDAIIESCSAEWLADGAVTEPSGRKTPCFVLGLPRTGTTLTERIISSHSQVQTVGETELMEFALRKVSNVETRDRMNADVARAAAGEDIRRIGDEYLNLIDYALGDEPIFVDKLPYNFLFIGFIAKAYPDARIVHLNRHPMDSCFSMYKQVFTWAFKFSYTLDNLADFYIAYRRLMDHWREVLGDRIIDVHYEELVSDSEGQTRTLLEKLGLEFEEACLHFEKNKAASATASSVQIREKAHTRSVARWKRFEEQLQPLAERLREAGIEV